MRSIKYFFTKRIIRDSIFSLCFAIFMMAASLILKSKYELFTFILAGSTLLFLIILVPLIQKLNKLPAFLSSLRDVPNDHYKTIENSLFFKSCIASYSFRKLVIISYETIDLVRYSGNVFEVARPGYKGNHKVYIHSSQTDILILMPDEKSSQQLLNYLQTKNSAIVFENKTSDFINTELSDLSNCSVKSRF